jgi:hypothetical protein
MTRRKRCPNCGSRDTVPIVHGLVLPEPSGPIARDEVDVGGRILEDGQPLRRCRACGRGFWFRDLGGGREESE